MGKRQTAAMQTRLSVIAAAEKLISEKGFEGVTIDDIAREAGVAKGTFYTYFKRKEDVVSEIAQSNFVNIQKKSMQINGDVCDRLSFFLTDSMRYIVETGLKICQQWLKNVVEPQDKDGKRKLLYDKGVIEGILNQALASGELVPETPIADIREWIVAEYYGVVACWGILDGAIEPISILEGYCQGQLRDSLRKYMR